MKAIFHIILIAGALSLFGSYTADAQPRPRRSDIGIPGVTKPKASQVKAPKVKYKFHEGTALLKSGLVLNGKFKYTEIKNEVPLYQFVEKETKNKKKVALSMIEKLVLNGAEKGITARFDSTEFVWIDKFKDLYRKVRIGSINVYDNSRVVDEKYDYLTDYILLAGREDYGYKLIRQLSDLQILMNDRPYFIQAAEATNRADTKDFRVVIYLVDLFNDKKAIDVLKWDDMSVTLKDGKSFSGKGYIQPLDLRNEYVPSTKAVVHFYDGSDFRLLEHRNIASLVVNHTEYVRGLYTVTNKNFFGKPWIYKGEKFVIVDRITTNNNFYFRNKRNPSQSLLVLKEVAGSFIRPVNETSLRQQYITESKGGSSSSSTNR